MREIPIFIKHIKIKHRAKKVHTIFTLLYLQERLNYIIPLKNIFTNSFSLFPSLSADVNTSGLTSFGPRFFLRSA